MTDRELMQQALEALDGLSEPYDVLRIQTALRERLARQEQQPWEQLHPEMGNPFARQEQEPVAHVTVAGVLFDFMGWLTSRKERIVLSSADNASPAVEAITEFAKMRSLSLADANVQSWQQALAAAPLREWVGLTEQDFSAINQSCLTKLQAATCAESILKEKNGQ
jgi:hypothetical protein